MENYGSPLPASIERCTACFAAINIDDGFCADCRYPLKGNLAEQEVFMAKHNKREIALAGAKVSVKQSVSNAGDTLYYLAGFSLFICIIDFLILSDSPYILSIIIPKLIASALFLLLGEYSKTKMLASFISGLCLLVIIEILDIIANPQNIGLINFIVVTIIIVYLIKGIKSAIEIDKTAMKG